MSFLAETCTLRYLKYLIEKYFAVTKRFNTSRSSAISQSLGNCCASFILHPMPFLCCEFETKNEVERSWLISILSDYGFEGFEETTQELKGYVQAQKITPLQLRELLHDNDLSAIPLCITELEDKNWNEEWEKNFTTVIIAGKVGIRAPFHKPLETKHEIVIEPKMSFGTGHHETTAAMIELMLTLDFKNKQVLDFGCGTGVLSILAEKLNAKKVVAIDNEEWAYENCLENIERNKCVDISAVWNDDSHKFVEQFDIVLANINRNVILKNIAKWKSLLNENGILLVSGILLSDEKDVAAEGEKNGLKVKEILKNNGWVAIELTCK